MVLKPQLLRTRHPLVALQSMEKISSSLFLWDSSLERGLQ